jgi:UPF0176 protein
MSFVVATFYHFFDFADYADKKQDLMSQLHKGGIKGSLLIAAEGMNATLAGTREAIDQFLHYLRQDIIRGELEHKESLCDRQPFARAKVRLKKETISLGESVNPAMRGTYVEPHDWNRLISDPDMLVLDTRNSYEVHLGTFDKAVDPSIRTFKELPDFVRQTLDPARHRKIATFCTGGIRCEKFTAWMRQQGFEGVYHLKGGILKYLEEVPESESKWQGECYVFDERVAVGHGLAPSKTASSCPACGHALTEKDKTHHSFAENLSCPYCATKPR